MGKKSKAVTISFFIWTTATLGADQINTNSGIESLQKTIDGYLSPPVNQCSNHQVFRDQTLKSSKLGMTITSRCSSSFYLDSEPDLLNKMNAFAESTIMEGIERIEKYNPPLACEIRRRLPSKPFLLAWKVQPMGVTLSLNQTSFFGLV